MSEFQHDASEQGRLFDELARMVCRQAGFAVGERPFEVPELGIEVDAELTAKNGTVLWAEFKGSWRGRRPGLRRTDTVKKALCDALLVWADDEGYPPFIVLTSHHPEPGGRSARMVAAALGLGAVTAVLNVNDPNDVMRLRQIAETS